MNLNNLQSALGEALTSTGGAVGLTGLFLVRLQGMAAINGSLGYGVGNRMLALFQERLQGMAATPRHRVVLLAPHRVAIVVTGLANEHYANLAAAKVLRTFADPVRVEGRDLVLRLNIGVAVMPAAGMGTDATEPLLQQAEVALGHARSTGDAVVTLTDEVRERVGTKWDLEARLRTALSVGEFELYFQPKLALGKPDLVVGAEALVRWNSPDRGLVYPARFIPVVERSDLVQPLNWYCIKSAVRQCADWQVDHEGVGVSVNVPPALVCDGEILNVVRDALSIWGLDARLLTLEVTESAVMEHREASQEVMAALRALGVRISIDDFGTGFSSLAHFRDLQADELKIDRSFVARMVTDRAEARIVRAVIALAHGFDLTVVAEGVEDEAALEHVRRADCDLVQGFLYSRPLPVVEFRSWLTRRVQKQQAERERSDAGVVRLAR